MWMIFWQNKRFVLIFRANELHPVLCVKNAFFPDWGYFEHTFCGKAKVSKAQKHRKYFAELYTEDCVGQWKENPWLSKSNKKIGSDGIQTKSSVFISNEEKKNCMFGDLTQTILARKANCVEGWKTTKSPAKDIQPKAAHKRQQRTPSARAVAKLRSGARGADTRRKIKRCALLGAQPKWAQRARGILGWGLCVFYRGPGLAQPMRRSPAAASGCGGVDGYPLRNSTRRSI